MKLVGLVACCILLPLAAHAATITNATIDLDAEPPTITLEGFEFGPVQGDGEVYQLIGGILTKLDPVLVWGDGIVLAPLGEASGGTYLFALKPDSGPAGFMDVTLGAVGPPGPEGPQGEKGEQGDTGPPGPPGDSHWGLSGSDTYYDDGRVGIGTSQPTEDLHVQGAILASSDITTEDDLEVTSTLRIFGEAGDTRVFIRSISDDQGYVDIEGPAGEDNVILSTWGSNPDHGYAGVMDSTGNDQAAMYVNGNGEGVIFSDIQSVRMESSVDPSSTIWYAGLTGPEVGAYLRGTAELHAGEARVEFPTHFAEIVSPLGLTITLTPRSPESLGLAIQSSGVDGFAARELHGGTGSYPFDYLVLGGRRGQEDYPVVRPVLESVSQFARNPADEG